MGPGGDVGVFQVHDAFTIAEAQGGEPEGDGLYRNDKGVTSLGCRLPTSTDGGILSRGLPIGATGVAQLIEIVRQLSGEAGGRQIEPRPTVGVGQNLGDGESGGGVAVVVSR